MSRRDPPNDNSQEQFPISRLNDEGLARQRTLHPNDPSILPARSYPTCESCGGRCPELHALTRHEIRSCIGPVNGRHVVQLRLSPTAREEFERMLVETRTRFAAEVPDAA